MPPRRRLDAAANDNDVAAADDRADDAQAPAVSAVHFKLDTLVKNVVQLNLKNFHEWKTSIERVAFFRDWPANFLNHQADPWDGVLERDINTRKLRKEAYFVLVCSIPQDLQYIIEGVRQGDANGIWTRLHTRFQQPTTTHTGMKMADFWSMTMESENLPVDRFISKIRQGALSLKSMGREPSAADCSSVLLKGLLPEFHAIRTALRQANPANFEDIASAVLSYADDNGYNLLKRAARSHTKSSGNILYTDVKTKPNGSKKEVCKNYLKGKCKWGAKCFRQHPSSKTSSSTSATSTGGQNKKHQPKCWVCDVVGHKSNNCPQKSKVKALLTSHSAFSPARESKQQQPLPSDDSGFVLMVRISEEIFFLGPDIQRSTPTWVFDGAATSHICNDESMFIPGSLRPCKAEVLIGNGDVIYVTKIGRVQLAHNVQLKDVYYVPECPLCLLSESTMDKAGVYTVKGDGRIQALLQGQLLLQGVLSKGLYYLTGQPRNTNVDCEMIELTRAKAMPGSAFLTPVEKPFRSSGLEPGTTSSRGRRSTTEPSRLVDHNTTLQNFVQCCDSSVNLKSMPAPRLELGVKCSGGRCSTTETPQLCADKPISQKLVQSSDPPFCFKNLPSPGVELSTPGVEAQRSTARPSALLSTSKDTMLLFGEPELLRFHEQHGHPNMRTCRAMLGLPAAKPNEDPRCEACDLAKSAKQSLPKQSTTRASKILHRIMVDQSGRKTKSLGGYRCFQLAVDDCSRKRFVDLLRLKSEGLQKFQDLRRRLELENAPLKVAIVRTDGGGEFNSGEWTSWCTGQGIKHEFSAPYRQDQNGVAERSIGIVWKAAQAMMIKANSPRYDWTYAVLYATFLWNHIPSSANDGLSPNEVFYGFRRRFVTDGIFGCLGYAKIYKRGKQEPTARRVLYLGHNEQYKAYMVRDLESPRSKRVFFCRDVKFHNTRFPYQHALVPQPPPPPQSDSDDEGEATSDLTRHDVPLPDHGLHFDESETSTSVMSVPRTDAPLLDEVAAAPDFEAEATTTRKSSRTREPSAKALDNLVTAAEGGAAMLTSDATSRQKTKIRAFIAPDIVDPNTRSQALRSPNASYWLSAEQDEMSSIYAHDVWGLVPRVPGMNILGCRFVYKTKRKPGGEIEKFKARLVAQGFKQEYGIDFFETFAATINLDSVRLIFAIASFHDLPLLSIDIKTFFLYGDIDTDIYMEQPRGYEEKDPKIWVCKLKKSLYGTKQAPRCAKEKLTTALTDIGFKCLPSDADVFIIRSSETEFLLMGIHVDDFIVTYNSEQLKETVLQMLELTFDIKTTVEPNVFLGMQIERNYSRGYLKLHQTAYIEDLLKKFKMSDSNPAPTPMSAGYQLQDPKTIVQTDDDKSLPFQSAVGSLIWLRLTRPDVAFAVGVLCRYMTKYTQQEWVLVKRVLRYLRGSFDRGLVYWSQRVQSSDADSLLKGWCDSDFAGRTFDSRSTYGYVFKYAGSAISFRSAVERRVATSTCEAESYALQHACKQVQWMRNLLSDIDFLGTGPTTVYEDNEGAIKLSKNAVWHKRSKHYRICQDYIRSLVAHEIVSVEKVATQDMEADIFTKPLTPAVFKKFADLIMGYNYF